jgi:hypothetical protein
MLWPLLWGLTLCKNCLRKAYREGKRNTVTLHSREHPRKGVGQTLPGIVLPGSREARFGGLLDDEVVLDVLHIGNGRSIFACCGLLVRSVHKAAELDDSLVRLDFDLE